MVRYRKGELSLYKSMNPVELSEYINKFPQHTEYVKKFLEGYKYIWVKKQWIHFLGRLHWL